MSLAASQLHLFLTDVQAHYATILRLKQYFPFSLIDAMGGLEDTRAQISRELRYQSSLDLDEATYAAIRHLPLAQDLVRASRQQLVHRLDTYSKRHHKIFMEVGAVLYCMGVHTGSVAWDGVAWQHRTQGDGCSDEA